ncbi:IS1 family transposase [Kistimonas asteriae]|uniref:IS1 family transposase n=1 Tax=Kistimonas asteriae TaxID=517724 RepID=UPI001BA8288C|nr:IS1 family transposase [Kistimonas asteriae]
MAKIDVVCAHCDGTKAVVRNGKVPSGLQRYLCRDCKHSFQIEFIYNANQSGTHERIIDMAMNGAGVRDTGRVPNISPNTVFRHFKKLSPQQVTSHPFEKARVELLCEMDEQWSFVGNKRNQWWLFYAWEPRFKRVIAHAFGRRAESTLQSLLRLLEPYSFSFYCTDNWSPYTSHLPENRHVIGKLFTQRIERNNLTLRTRLKRLARKTICFSRSEELHDKVIGEFISRTHYQRV